MIDRPAPTRGLRAGALVALAAFPLCALLVLAGLGLQLRHDLSAAGASLERRAAALAARSPRDIVEARRLVARARVPARLTTADGTVLARSGPEVAWSAGPAGLAVRLATAGTGGFGVRNGWTAAESRIGEGGRLELRERMAAGLGGISGASLAWGLGAAALAALLASLAGALVARRVGARARRATLAADALATGRALPGDRPPHGEWRRLDEALRRVGGRLGELQGEAAVDAGGLSAAVAPLPLPVAVRTPTGGRARNEALERLSAALAPADARALDAAVRTGLDASGAVSRRLELADGRVLEVESWPLPGGRVVAVPERTEQDRLARLREGLSGSAVRHLRAPVREVQAASAELYAQVPAPLAPGVRRVAAAADRMERLIGTLLRGTDQDPALRAARREAVGAAGLLWGVAQRWERPLRSRGLRVEVDAGPGLPPLWTDPKLVQEVLDQLLENAASYTPRGGTVTLAAREGRDRTVALEVRDTGGGFAPDEVAHARERFYRGRAADALPGAGLGLGVASALAERLGGRLDVEAGPGGLARLELPAARPAGEDTARRPALAVPTASS